MGAYGFALFYCLQSAREREQRARERENTQIKVVKGELGRPDVILIITPGRDWKAP